MRRIRPDDLPSPAEYRDRQEDIDLAAKLTDGELFEALDDADGEGRKRLKLKSTREESTHEGRPDTSADRAV